MDIYSEFGRSVGALSTVTKELVAFLHERWARRLVHELDPERLRPRIRRYANAIARKCGNILTHVFAFIDGTLRPTARYEGRLPLCLITPA